MALQEFIVPVNNVYVIACVCMRVTARVYVRACEFESVEFAMISRTNSFACAFTHPHVRVRIQRLHEYTGYYQQASLSCLRARIHKDP